MNKKKDSTLNSTHIILCWTDIHNHIYDKETYRQIRRLKALCDSLLGWIDTTGTDYPSYADRLSVHKWSLARIAQRCIKMQLQYGKNRLATDI